MSSFQKRVVSGAAALLVLGTILYVKGIAFDLAILVIGLLAGYEFYNAFKAKGHEPKLFVIFSLIVTYLLAILFIFMNDRSPEDQFLGLLLFISLIFIYFLIALFVSLTKKMQPIDMLINLFALFYIAIPLGMLIIFSKTDEHSFKLVYLVLMISFFSDSFAYLTGKSIGKHKLAPKMSPNKTIEGSLGAIIGTALVLAILKGQGFFENFFNIPYVIAILLGILGSIMAQIGDLTASILKRYTGIKDFGNIMPGHGGILDRLDSIIFVTPMVFITYYGILYIAFN